MSQTIIATATTATHDRDNTAYQPEQPQSTARMLSLLNAYSQDNSDYHEAMHAMRKIERRRLTRQRLISHELKRSGLNELSLEEQQMTVKVVKTTPKVVIDSEHDIPDNYIRHRPMKMFDVRRIKNDIAAGKKVPGVRMEVSQDVNIDITVPVLCK